MSFGGRLIWILLILLVATGRPGVAQIEGEEELTPEEREAALLNLRCTSSPTPAATLLLPYFQVDLEDPQGRTTLLTVGNSGDSPQLARVALWTDWGRPTFSFDLLIPSQGLVPINMRDIFVDGVLPAASAGLERPASCADPLIQPVPNLDELRSKHGGLPFPADTNSCFGSSRGRAEAVGFATIDAIKDCSDSIRFPFEDGYFAVDEEEALASQENVLFGDFVIVEPNNESAQGAALFHLRADRAAVGEFEESFYTGFRVSSSADARRKFRPFAQTRYLTGGAFDGSTELLIFAQPLFSFVTGPSLCALPEIGLGSVGQNISYLYEFRADGAEEEHLGVIRHAPMASRIEVVNKPTLVGPQIVVDGDSGTIRIISRANCPICSPSTLVGVQGIAVIPLITAEGRFSVASEAVGIARLTRRGCLAPSEQGD